MDTRQIKVEPAQWSDEAARCLARSIRCAPLFTVADYRREVANGAKLFRVAGEPGLIGYVLLRVDVFEGGAEGVIVAGAGACAGVDLTTALVPAFESMFKGVTHVRIDTARPGLVRKLTRRLGYSVTHYTLRKAIHAPA